MAGLADVGSLSENESGNQTVLSVDLALAGGNLDAERLQGASVRDLPFSAVLTQAFEAAASFL